MYESVIYFSPNRRLSLTGLIQQATGQNIFKQIIAYFLKDRFFFFSKG